MVESADSESLLGGDSHGHSHARTEAHKRPLFFALVLTLVFTIAQIIAARIANSLSLIADALHHLVDAAMVVAALVAIELSQRDTARGHLYVDATNGHAHHFAELVAAVVNSVLLLGLSVGIIVEAAMRIEEDETETDGLLVVVLAGISILVNVIKVYWLHAHMVESLNVRAIYVHTLADCASSVGLLVGGIIVMSTGNSCWDGIMAIVIAVFVILNVGWVLIPAIRVLRQGPDTHGSNVDGPAAPTNGKGQAQGDVNTVNDCDGQAGAVTNVNSSVQPGNTNNDPLTVKAESNPVSSNSDAQPPVQSDTSEPTTVTTEAPVSGNSDAQSDANDELSTMEAEAHPASVK